MEEFTPDMLAWEFYANPLSAWIAAAVILTVVFVAALLVRTLVLRHLRGLERRAEGVERTMELPISEAIGRTQRWFLALVALWAATLPLVLPARFDRMLSSIVIIALLIQMGIWISSALTVWARRFEARNLETDAAAVTTIRALTFLSKVAVYTIIFMMALANLGIEITAVIAGLGVGGIAVALAIQNILGDLFASLSIVLDKPFVVGDFIIVGELLGTVEYIGLKTTRVRSLSGEQLVFSNSDLLNSRIRNFKRMQERRIVFEFGVVYQTPPEKLEEIPELIREIIEERDDTRFDRAHFKGFADFSLTFEVVYHVLSADFNVYMDIQQYINLALYRGLQARGIEFAYPTRTVYVRGGDGRPATDEAAVGR